MKASAKLRFAKRLLTEINPSSSAFMSFKELRGPIFSVRYTDGKKRVLVPNAVYMHVTNYCEEKCKGCYIQNKSDVSTMPEEMIDGVFRDGKDMGVNYYAFLGGEPFSDASRRLVIDSIKKHPTQRIVACTNARYLDDAVMDELDKLPNFSVLYSLDGFKDSNDYRRGGGAFKITTNAMKEAKERGMVSGVISLVTDKNYLEISSDDFIEFIIQNGTIYISYSPIHCKTSMPSPEQYATLIERINKIAHEYPILIHSDNFGRLHGSKEINLKRHGLRGISVGLDGAVSCSRVSGESGRLEPPEYSLKSVIEDSFFQENFQSRFHGDDFEGFSSMDKRYPLFGETIDILRGRGYDISRPAISSVYS